MGKLQFDGKLLLVHGQIAWYQIEIFKLQVASVLTSILHRKVFVWPHLETYVHGYSWLFRM